MFFKWEALAKVVKKKAFDLKRRLLKAHKVLKRAYEEVDHYRSKCVGYILEKTTLGSAFIEERGKLSEQIFQVS